MLNQIISEKWLEARARFGLFPAYSQGDDIMICDPEDSHKVISKWLTLRQQLRRRQDSLIALWPIISLLHRQAIQIIAAPFVFLLDLAPKKKQLPLKLRMTITALL